MNIPIYVISLTRSVGRREKIAKQFNSLGIPFEIFNAVDGKELDMSQIADRIDDQNVWRRGVELQAGEIGCYLSHESVWQKIVAEKISCAIILEDDAILSDDFSDIFNALPNINYRWEIVRLSASFPSKVLRSVPLTKKRNLVRYGGIYVCSAAAYLISLRGAETLCHHSRKIQCPVDVMYDEPWKTGLHFWDVHPPAVGHSPAEDSLIWQDVIKARRNRPKRSLWKRLRKLAGKCYVPLVRRLWNIFNPPIKK